MTHYTIVNERQFLELLTKGTLALVLENNEKYNCGESMIVQEYNRKGGYISGLQEIATIMISAEVTTMELKKYKLIAINMNRTPHT